MAAKRWCRSGRGGLFCALAALAMGCEDDALGRRLAIGGELPHAAKLEAAPALAGEIPAWARVPIPPEDGPKLAPVVLNVAVYGQPSRNEPAIGSLRLGAKVSRSEQPVSKENCAAGWFALRPLGFVCADRDVSVRMDHPVVRALGVEPDRSRPLPYAYAFVRAIAPNYLRVPTQAEQLEYEMRLERHLRSWRKLATEWDRMEPGANDVPLDARGIATGKIPEGTAAPGLSQRFGGDGSDRIPWWLQRERRIPNLSSFQAPAYAVIADRIKRHAGVALVGSFVSGPEAGERRFAVSVDGRLLPADKLKAEAASPYHGADISKTGLPVAFAWERGSNHWTLADGKVERGEPLEPRQMVPLTGRVLEPAGVRMVETRDGQWLRSRDLRTIPKPTQLPWFAKGTTRWIEISILAQTLVLWEGARPVYATLVSTGRDGLGDPKTTASTPTGTFRIYQKHVTTTMDSEVSESEFELRDVPWVMYFKGGYALHGAYWHDEFGRARSHGCVNLSPIDARYVFLWTAPQVPEHWHAAYAGDSFGSGTLVHIH